MEKSHTLLFASEIKGILAHPLADAQIDAQGVAELLLMGPGRTPGCGVFSGIKELRPGEFMTGYPQGNAGKTLVEAFGRAAHGNL